MVADDLTGDGFAIEDFLIDGFKGDGTGSGAKGVLNI